MLTQDLIMKTYHNARAYLADGLDQAKASAEKWNAVEAYAEDVYTCPDGLSFTVLVTWNRDWLKIEFMADNGDHEIFDSVYEAADELAAIILTPYISEERNHAAA